MFTKNACFVFASLFGDLRRVCFISQHSKILSGMFLRNYIPQEPGAFWMVDKLQIDEIFRSSPSWSPPKPRIHRSRSPLLRCSENAIQRTGQQLMISRTKSSRKANYMKLNVKVSASAIYLSETIIVYLFYS